MLEVQESGVRRFQIIIAAPRPRREGEADVRVGPWYETHDGTMIRTVIFPPGTDKETRRQILATP
jgi:hypothetical protein